MTDPGGSEVPESGLKRWARKTIAIAKTIGWSGVGAIVAVLALILTVMQQQSFRLDKRAWVTTSRFQVQRLGSETTFMGFFENSGETPARYVIATSGCRYEKPMSQEFDDFDAKQPEMAATQFASVVVIAPGGKYDGSIECARHEKDRKDPLYLYGVVTYSDIYDQKHRTDYCNWYTPEMKKLLTACSDFNRLVY